jgi:hypothetical protein
MLVASPEPSNDAAHLVRMIDREVRTEPDGAAKVSSGSDRAEFVFLTKDQLSRRYPEVPVAGSTRARRRGVRDRNVGSGSR